MNRREAFLAVLGWLCYVALGIFFGWLGQEYDRADATWAGYICITTATLPIALWINTKVEAWTKAGGAK